MQESNRSLEREWQTLQGDHERYEQMALIIKLAATLSCIFTFGYFVLALSIIAVLWLQEGIWKTWQHRTAQRLMEIEKMLRSGSGEAFQFHSRWDANRPGAIGLITEYISNSLRPTVAFPYVVLMGVIAAVRFISI